MKNISVLGAGSWGTALSVMLATYGKREVTLWSKFEDQVERLSKARENELLPGIQIPENVHLTTDLEEALKNDIIVLGVPSFAVRETAARLKGKLRKNQVLVNIAKGLEEETLKRMSEVVKEELDFPNYVILSGPSHAEEVAKGIPAALVVASTNIKTAQIIQDEFMNETFRLYTSDDIIGVELGGALKNVIALLAGITDAMGFGDNAKSALMTRGITEMARLGVAMGARRETFGGLSGVGDLITTCISMHSRNRKAGLLIGGGKSVEEAIREVGMVVEGYKTAGAAYELAKRHKIEMPIVAEAYNILYRGKDLHDATSDLMGRKKKHESEEIWIKDN